MLLSEYQWKAEDVTDTNIRWSLRQVDSQMTSESLILVSEIWDYMTCSLSDVPVVISLIQLSSRLTLSWTQYPCLF